ncbi:hypothetical protein GC170_03755 [bacterium]|nr:hypothetical protein [bacterium]
MVPEETNDPDRGQHGEIPGMSDYDDHQPKPRGEFTVGDVLSRSWEILRSDTFRIAGTIWAGIALITFVLIFQAAIFDDPNRRGQPPVLAQLLVALPGWCIIALVIAGMHLFVVNVASGRKARFGDLSRCRKFAGTILIADLLFGLVAGGTQWIVIFGTLILGELIGPFALMIGIFAGIPLLYAVYFSLSQFQFLVVDRETKPLQSLQLSWELMRGHRLEYLYLNLICGVINIVGFLACGFGILITLPLQFVSFAVFYLALTGQPVADPYGWSQRTAEKLHGQA